MTMCTKQRCFFLSASRDVVIRQMEQDLHKMSDLKKNRFSCLPEPSYPDKTQLITKTLKFVPCIDGLHLCLGGGC